MSQQTIERLHSVFLEQVDSACAEGRGLALLEKFIAEMAADYASSIFLILETTVTQNERDCTLDEIADHVSDLATEYGLRFVASTSSVLRNFGASSDQQETAEILAANAYREQLEFLMGRAQARGSA